MATSTEKLEKDTWTLLATASCDFQPIGGNNIYVKESVALPTDLYDYKIANPKEMYVFTKKDGNLYGYSPDIPTQVSIDLI